jgi:hypothetical protein
MKYPIGLLSAPAELSCRTIDMKTIRVAALSAFALVAMVYPVSSWAEEWGDAITHVRGTPKAGNKNFVATNGEIGSDRGRTTKLRVARAGLAKQADFKNSWKGSISFTFADNGERGSFNCAFDKKTNGYYIFNVLH